LGKMWCEGITDVQLEVAALTPQIFNNQTS